MNEELNQDPIVKQAPTEEELRECAFTQYRKESSPPTPEQIRNREEAHARFLQLKQKNQREFEMGDEIISGKYEVGEV